MFGLVTGCLAGRRSLTTMCAILAILALQGCTRPQGKQEPDTVLAQQAADEITQFLGNSSRGLEVAPGLAVLPSDVSRRIEVYVWKRVQSGDHLGLTAMINTEGPWQKAPWFHAVALGYARTCYLGERPINIQEAKSMVAALRNLSRPGITRAIRVFAAAAIRFDDPEAARCALEDTYADISLNPGIPGGFWIEDTEPETGPALLSVGVLVPDECTGVEMVADILRKPSELETPEGRRRLAETGNRYNRLLRQKMVSQSYEWLKGWADAEAARKLIAEIFDGLPDQKN